MTTVWQMCRHIPILLPLTWWGHNSLFVGRKKDRNSIYNVEITEMMWYSWVCVCVWQFVFFHSLLCQLLLIYCSPGSLWLSTRFTLNSPGRWVACWGVLLSQYAFIKMLSLPVCYCASSPNLKKPHNNPEIFLNRTLKHRFTLPASKETFSSCICISQKKRSHLLACAHTIYVLSRPSPGWGDCGGSCTLFGSMSEVYTLGSSCWNGPQTPLDKLQRTSTSPGEPLMRRKRRRSCPSSHPLSGTPGSFLMMRSSSSSPLAPFWWFNVELVTTGAAVEGPTHID